MTGPLKTVGRRHIAPGEGRSVALEILRRAEAERATLVQSEAERGIDWEEDPTDDE